MTDMSVIVPNFPAAMRLDGRSFLILGVGPGLGRQVAHALRQFGATIFCCGHDAEVAEQLAFEVGGTQLRGPAASAAQLRDLLTDLTRQGLSMDGVVELLDHGRHEGCAERARAAGHHCAQQGAGSLVLIAGGGDLAAVEGRFAAVVTELAQEFADEGVRVNGVVPASLAESEAAGIVAFLCSNLAQPLSGQVLLANSVGAETAV
jgi:NAD(P)-dependent dehydrogenase (short-subunit alcohol dehydrogenase family)